MVTDLKFSNQSGSLFHTNQSLFFQRHILTVCEYINSNVTFIIIATENQMGC